MTKSKVADRSFFDQVYAVTKLIPVGKVATYGQIAHVLGTADSRKIGWALHANTSESVPCHRVVTKAGKVAVNLAFDGWAEQVRRLTSEGVAFIDEMHVNLGVHLVNSDRLIHH